MNFRITFLIIISIFLTACPSTEEPKTNNNAVNKNTAVNNVAANTNSPIVNPTAKPVADTINNAPTLAPVVQAYYDALKKKDDAAIRKVLSAEFIKTLEADMKEEGKKSLSAFIAELDKVPEKPVEVRNEKIEGEKGVAEIKGGVYVNWTPISFVKEDGVWKMSNESPDITSVQKPTNSATTTNKAK
jgi:hypothetical protein